MYYQVTAYISTETAGQNVHYHVILRDNCGVLQTGT